MLRLQTLEDPLSRMTLLRRFVLIRFQNLLEQSDDRLNEPAIRDRVSKPTTQASALTRRSLADGDTRPVISTQTSAAEGLLQRLATMRAANARVAST